jgi:heptose I phosphotransferase
MIGRGQYSVIKNVILNGRKKILLKKISALAKKMHQKGFNHRDFNATHILLDYSTGPYAPGIALFDLQRVEKNKFFHFRWKIKSLARLNYSLPGKIFTDPDRLSILLYYNDRTSPNIIDRLQWFWIQKKTARIKRHTEKKRMEM